MGSGWCQNPSKQRSNEVFLFSGTVFGWGAFSSMLQKAGVFLFQLRVSAGFLDDAIAISGTCMCVFAFMPAYITYDTV